VADIHVTQELLDAVVSGRVAGQVLAQVGWQHLMALCPFCRAEFDTWQRSRRASCAAGALNVLPLVAERQARSFDEKRGRAERDLRELLQLSHEKRVTRVRRANSRFRGALLARLLLEAAERHIPAEPKVVYELAETAQAVLSRTPAAEGVSDLYARATIYMGNALRAQGNLKAADWHFTFARHIIVHNGVTDPLTIAEVDWFEGTLRKDQRRFDEAEELLVRAVTFYRLAGEERRAAYPLVTLGLLQADRQDHRHARDAFLLALRLIDTAKDARLYCYAHHNLIRTLCFLGHYTAAAESLASGRDLYLQHPDLYTRSRLVWLEGMIAAGLGHFDEAEAAFLSLRQHFLEEGNGYDAGMVSLDLALLYLKTQRMGELRQLAEELLPIFEAEDLHAESRAALMLFQEAVREERVTVTFVEELAAYLNRVRTDFTLRFRERG
jgi:tetratricopeptide (TPR) repeat protein